MELQQLKASLANESEAKQQLYDELKKTQEVLQTAEQFVALLQLIFIVEDLSCLERIFV